MMASQNKNKVWVVIPAHNEEKYIEEDFRFMRAMCIALREWKNAPLIELKNKIYELEMDEQEIGEFEFGQASQKSEKKK